MEKEKINRLVIGIFIVLIFLVALFVFIEPLLRMKKNTIQKKQPDATSLYLEGLKNADKMNPDDLRKKMLIENKNDLIVIDIRPADDYDKEHIWDSINIPYQDMLQAINSLDKEKIYVLVDSGSDLEAAYVAGGIFVKNGFSKAFYLNGGFGAWKDKVGLSVSEGDLTSFADQAKVSLLTSDDLKKRLETEKNMYILDIRDKSQFASGHINGAINIPLNNLEKERQNVPRGKKLVVCDEDGFEAFRAGVKLFDFGFLNVNVLSDGLKTWKEKGYEIVK